MGKFARRLPQVLLAVFVILAATAVSGFFGLMMTVLIDLDGAANVRLFHVGTDVGAVAGCLVAILWLLAMRRVMRRPEARIILVGGGLGMAAGLLASLILHASLLASGSPIGVVSSLAMAAMFGLPAGFITGLISGLAAWGVAKWSRHHE